MKYEFNEKGYCKINELIPFNEVKQLCILYDGLLRDKERTAGLRSDLSGAKTKTEKVEKITQIMRPSLIEEKLLETETYKIATQYAKKLLGVDMELDFDMLINKAPFTYTETPWHQDAAYWIKMPDKRSVSCWIALDDVYENNGCMWFIPKEKNQEILPHKALPNGGALYCDADMSKAECMPLIEGGCTFHDGYTLHFSKGNKTASQRRALILNFRPAAMIALERDQGIDHTGNRALRNEK